MSETVERTLSERLEAVRLAADGSAERSPEARRQILEARARQLARPLPSADADGGTIDLIVFQTGDERLAITVANVVSISRPGAIARLPRVVAPVYGVTGWRGRPLTVLSLAAEQQPSTDDSRLIVLGTGTRANIALLADAVHDFIRVASTELSPAGRGPRHAIALGMLTDGMLVVGGDALLRTDR